MQIYTQRRKQKKILGVAALIEHRLDYSHLKRLELSTEAKLSYYRTASSEMSQSLDY